MKARLAWAAGLALVVIVAVGAAVAFASLMGWRLTSSNDPRSGIDADTVRFTYGDRWVEVPLLECAREGDLVIMAGRRSGTVVQVAADLGEGGAARTGVSADLGEEGTLGAFGAELPPGPSGELTSVGAVGDSLVVEGRWVPLDPDTFAPDPAAGTAGTASPAPGPAGVEGRLVARCPDADDLASPP